MVQKKRSSLFILAGIALILFAVYSLKSAGNNGPATKLEEQLDQALKEGQPAFVFVHSLNCVACKEMISVVDQVYPEYQDAVVLIDVDVYDQALKGGQLAFVFLHSLNCVACKEMMAVVDQVYPEYQDAVVLIDVDVYQQSNADLLKREQVQSIPTLVFYDAEGARQVFIGAMPAEKFRDTLGQLVASQ